MRDRREQKSKIVLNDDIDLGENLEMSVKAILRK